MDDTNTILDDVCGVIGYTATTTMTAWYGGARLYVPNAVSELHPIAKAIGVSRFAALVHHFGGESIYIPDDVRREALNRRNKLVLDYLAAGARPKQIAEETGMARRRVEQVVAAIGEFDAKQAREGITSDTVLDALMRGEFAVKPQREKRPGEKAPGKAPLEKPPGKATPEKPPRKSHPRKATPFDALLPVEGEAQ